MIDYEWCYEIADYANTNWKGCFSPKEVACNAFILFNDIMSATRYCIPATLNSFLKNLYEDESEESIEIARDILRCIGANVETFEAKREILKSLYDILHDVYDLQAAVAKYEASEDNCSINDVDGFVKYYPFVGALEDMPDRLTDCINSVADAF